MTHACPACDAAPLAQRIAAPKDGCETLILSLPDIHCAGCIAGVERAAQSVAGVQDARVNLSQRRVTISGEGLDPDLMIAGLRDAGFTAFPLDTVALGKEADPVGRALLVRLAVAGFAMMNVMLFSVAVWSGATSATAHLFHLISGAIAIPALLYSAQVFFSSAWSALRGGRLNMDVPISLAIILAAALSVYETLTGGETVYFDAALSLTFFLLVGRYLDHRTRDAARSAARELTALASPHAIRLTDDGPQTVRADTLQVGDMISVTAGMRVPVDAEVVTGKSESDRSHLTGESVPVSVAPGDTLAAGEVNLAAPLTLRATAVGQDTTLARMAALVEQAEGTRNRYTALADRAAAIYAPAVHVLALVTFAGWMVLDAGFATALNIAISVLIITCPCALGLAVPAVTTAATGRLFRRGLLVKSGTALERLAEVDHVVFDKTGTLTTGHAKLDFSKLPVDDLRVLATLARSSAHPVAKAIAAAIPDQIGNAPVWEIKEHPGDGMSGMYQGERVRLGRGGWVDAIGSPAFQIGDAPAVALTLTEALRPGAKEVFAAMRERGLPMTMLTGDTPARADAIGDILGISDVRAGLSPTDKQAVVTALARDGRRVLMVGDGLNDTGALTAAHVSISPASALDAARTASDMVVMGDSLAALPETFIVARSARTRVIENFAIAAGYNAIAIPVAVLGFATPLAAAIAMSLSSITVLLNALRLR